MKGLYRALRVGTAFLHEKRAEFALFCRRFDGFHLVVISPEHLSVLDDDVFPLVFLASSDW